MTLHPYRPYLLLVAAISFGLGISLPLVQLEKFYFLTETPSLLGIIGGLWGAGDMALMAVITLFSLILPVAKLAVSYQSVFNQRPPAKWASMLAKWSMMDVLLVAILVFAAKTSGLATAIAQPGIWFFGLSAISTAIAAMGISHE